jgi:hypothetical protein
VAACLRAESVDFWNASRAPESEDFWASHRSARSASSWSQAEAPCTPCLASARSAVGLDAAAVIAWCISTYDSSPMMRMMTALTAMILFRTRPPLQRSRFATTELHARTSNCATPRL